MVMGKNSWVSPALMTIFFFIALYIIIQVIMFWWDVNKLIQAEERLCDKILAGDEFLQEQIDELTKEVDDIKDDLQPCLDDEVCTRFAELSSLAALYQGKYDPKNDLPFLIPNGNHPLTNPLAVTNNDGDIYYVVNDANTSLVSNNSRLGPGDLLIYDITCTAFLVIRGGVPALIALTEAGEGESLISDPVGPIMGIKKLVPFQGMAMTQIGDDGLRLEPLINFRNFGNGAKVLRNNNGYSGGAIFKTLVGEGIGVIANANEIFLRLEIQYRPGFMTRTYPVKTNAYAGKQFDFSELDKVNVIGKCSAGSIIIGCSCEANVFQGTDAFPALQNNFVQDGVNWCRCFWRMGVNAGAESIEYQAIAVCLGS